MRSLLAIVLGSLRIVCAWLALFVSSAQAAPGPPASVPPGYVQEHHGSTAWLYPSAARSEIADLREIAHDTWAELGRELGVYLRPELEIRIAVNPEHMQALAPRGRVLPAYATGVAFSADGLILISLTQPGNWARPNLERVLVHELAHVALHRAVLGQPIPRWLNEGFAIDRAGERSLARVRTLWEGALQGRLLDLRALSREFPEQPREVDLAYAQAADLAEYLFDRDDGGARFRLLLDRVRSGVVFERAIEEAYGVKLATLEQQWRAGIAARFGRWPTLLGGLSVVWATAALLLVAAYVRVRRRHQRTLARWAIEEGETQVLQLPTPAWATPPPTPPPPPYARTPADDVLDAWGDQHRRDPGIPTVVHDGRSYTLH